MVYTTSLATVAKNISVTINGTKIGEIADEGIPLPISLTEDIEVTNQDSGNFKEYKQGRRDGGECDITGNYVSSDPGQQALAAAAAAGTVDTYVVSLPNGSYWSFQALNKSFATPVKNKMIMFECKVKVTGAPVLAATKAALTGAFFTVAATGGTGAITYTPAQAATEGTYVVNVATGVTKVAITPISATGTITVNDVSVATGVASGDITLGGAGTVTTAYIKVSETAKATAIYTLLIARAAT